MEERCVCGDTGFLLNQTYGEAEIPDGWTPVQACDECRRFASDEEAAHAASQAMAAAVEWFPGTVDEDGEELHGEWAIEPRR